MLNYVFLYTIFAGGRGFTVALIMLITDSVLQKISI